MNPPAGPGLLLGLDIGTTRTKAVIIDAAGGEQAAAVVATPFTPSADGVDMAVADLARAVRAVVTALGAAREQVTAVGLAGMAESGAPFSAGHPAGPVVAWHDGRGEAAVASLERRFGPALSRWTGRRIRTVSSVAKLGWLLDHGLPRPDRWLGVPETVLFLLTGAEATEHSLAARTGAYHVAERRFLPEVVAHILGGVGGTAADLFPPVLAAGTAMGSVSEQAGATYGLPAGIPVTIAGHDHLAAAAGLGARPGDLLNSVGTAETLIRRLDQAPDIDRALDLDLAVTVWPGGDAWGVLASAARSGLVVDALARHLGLDPDRLDALAGGNAAPAAGRTGDRGTAGDGGTAGDRGGTGDRGGAGDRGDAGDRGTAGDRAGPAAPGATVQPVDTLGMAAGRTVDLGQGIVVPAGSAAEMWVATLRALTRRTAVAAGRVAAVAGPHQGLVVFGGGSRSPVWLGLKEAEIGVAVARSHVAEATARGAALAAGVAAGWWSSTAGGPVPPLGGTDTRAEP